MQKLQKDFREFIELLNSHGVRYMIAGGFAVAFHGFPRNTGDIDFLVETSPENARSLQHVLLEFGMGSLGLTAQDFTKLDVIVQLGYPPYRIDLLTSISGSTFEEAWKSRVETEIDGLPMVFIGKDVLIKNKAEVGRPKDLADLSRLTLDKKP